MVEKEEFTANVDAAIARNVKSARERSGMSQSELASRLTEMGVGGFHQTTVARIENGTRVLRLAEAVAIARLLDYQIEELVESPSASSLRWAYGELRDSVQSFWNSGQALFDQRLRTAQSLDARFPRNVDGSLSEADVLAVSPATFEMVEELLTTNSEPLERMETLYWSFRATMREHPHIEPFVSSRVMDIYEEVVVRGMGADRVTYRDDESDDAFQIAMAPFEKGGDDG